MNRTRDLISFVIALALMLGAAYQLKSFRWLTGDANIEAMHRHDSKRQMAILLGDDWTTFQVPGNTTSLRILSNAVIDSRSIRDFAPTLESPRQGYRYAIEYEFLDEHENTLRSGTYHYRSKPKEKWDIESGQLIQPLQLLVPDTSVAQTQFMQTSIQEDLRKTRMVRLRAAEIDNEVTEILGRVLCKTLRDNFDHFGAWDRISVDRKDQLARHSVYEHRLLDENSRRGLMKWQWNRATPFGDFERRHLYFVGDNDAPEVHEPLLPQGTIVQRGWKVVVPVSNKPSLLRVEATPLGDETPIHGQLHYTFDDPESDSRKTASLDFQTIDQSASKTVEIPDVTGLVELELECPAALRFFAPDPSSTTEVEWLEINLEPKHLPVYVADHRTVAFPVSHFENQVTPLKVSFRFTEDSLFDSTSPSGIGSATRSVHWRYVGDEGETIAHGIKQLTPETSAHERFWKDRFAFAVTDAIDLWFPVPPNVATVEFWSEDSPALVNAYARPHGLATQTRIPEDYNVIEKLDSPYRRWFVIRPVDHRSYTSGNRLLPLRVQPRLREIPDEEETESLVWNRFEPKGDWLAASIMVPVVDPLNVGDEKPDSVWLWHELKANEAMNYSILDRVSHYKNVQIAFASDRSDRPAGTFEVWSNDKLIASKTFASTRGEFEVNLPTQHGQLRCKFADGVDVFVSGLQTESNIAYFRRTAMRVGDTPTVFEYEKTTTEDEHLTLTLYRDESETSRAAINVRIVPHDVEATSHQPRDMWTIQNRSYDVSPLPVANSVLMDRPGKLDSGSRCFLKLGSDLTPGRYRIEVQREDSLSGYLLLYQTAPGEKSVRRIGIYDNRDYQ